MKIDFDPIKSVRNADERNLPFERMEDFEWKTAVIWQDVRKSYPEKRMLGLGHIDNRLHVVCFTPIEGGIRIISLRKANERERKNYEET